MSQPQGDRAESSLPTPLIRPQQAGRAESSPGAASGHAALASPEGDPVFHIAELTHWEAALTSPGRTYKRSTLGATLADVGFIHLSEAHQWQATLGRFYSAYEGDLVLLTIDPDRLTAPLVREIGNPATGELFPHLYGPLNVDAVIRVRALPRPTGDRPPSATR